MAPFTQIQRLASPSFSCALIYQLKVDKALVPLVGGEGLEVYRVRGAVTESTVSVWMEDAKGVKVTKVFSAPR